MKITISKEITFVPKFNGNQDLPEDEKIRVVIKNPSLAEKDRITEHPEARAKTDGKGSVAGVDIVLKINKLPIVKSLVKQIENLSYESEGKEIPVVTAADLIAAPMDLDPIFIEIADECERILRESEINAKN